MSWWDWVPARTNSNRVPVCFLAGTKILMSDGSYKNIETVNIGDILQSFNLTTKTLTTGKVLKTFIHKQPSSYLIINETLKLTPNHPVYVNGEWKEASSIKITDSLLYKNGSHVPVTSIKAATENAAQSYNLVVDAHHNYFADNILVHNK